MTVLAVVQAPFVLPRHVALATFEQWNRFAERAECRVAPEPGLRYATFDERHPAIFARILIETLRRGREGAGQSWSHVAYGWPDMAAI